LPRKVLKWLPLRKLPYAEYCFEKPKGEHARIAGTYTVNMDNKGKMKLYEAVPILKKFIEDPSSPDYVVIRMKPDRNGSSADLAPRIGTAR
jgi:hypothetical protein